MRLKLEANGYALVRGRTNEVVKLLRKGSLPGYTYWVCDDGGEYRPSELKAISESEYNARFDSFESEFFKSGILG